jgi:hypothetical protein
MFGPFREYSMFVSVRKYWAKYGPYMGHGPQKLTATEKTKKHIQGQNTHKTL